MDTAPLPNRNRTVVAALSLIMAPASMTIGDFMHPHETWDAAAQVAMVAESGARWYVAHLLLFVGIGRRWWLVRLFG